MFPPSYDVVLMLRAEVPSLGLGCVVVCSWRVHHVVYHGVCIKVCVLSCVYHGVCTMVYHGECGCVY
jgi:hypothetical protein